MAECAEMRRMQDIEDGIRAELRQERGDDVRIMLAQCALEAKKAQARHERHCTICCAVMVQTERVEA